jgi:hypothetical protein
MKNYIDSQQHWEDSVNADYDYMEAMEKEQEDNREQHDNREQGQQLPIDSVIVPKGTLVCEHPIDKRASFKSHGKDFCWKCGEHITN